MATNNAKKKKKKSAWLFGICVASLALTILLALADALLRTAGKHLLFLGQGGEFWLVWEVAAIFGALAGTFVFWLVQYGVEPKIHQLMHRGWIKGLSPIIIFCTLGAFIGAAWVALHHGHICVQLLWLCGGVLGFVLVQGMFLWDTANPPGNQTKKNRKADLDQAREDFRGAMMYSDLPALGAFSTLLVVVYILLNCVREDLLRPFVGGIVAFELVTTTVVFVIEYWYTPKYFQDKFPQFVSWWKRLLE